MDGRREDESAGGGEAQAGRDRGTKGQTNGQTEGECRGRETQAGGAVARGPGISGVADHGQTPRHAAPPGPPIVQWQFRSTVRVHGVITDGGTKPNIIPDFTRAEFYCRAPSLEENEVVAKKVVACAVSV